MPAEIFVTLSFSNAVNVIETNYLPPLKPIVSVRPSLKGETIPTVLGNNPLAVHLNVLGNVVLLVLVIVVEAAFKSADKSKIILVQ